VEKVLVCGGGGFIGGHLVKRLKEEGFWVRVVDLKNHEYSESPADDFWVADLRDPKTCELACAGMDYIYQLAADMGGAGFVFTGDNDADILHNSASININMSYYAEKAKVKRIFYSSSACAYPARNQMDPNNPNCEESSAYPADPDSEYGWEKIFSERIYKAFTKNYGLVTRVARFHNIYGIEGSWVGGREKAPAAMCRKVAETPDGGEMEVWGTGEQTRSFLYVDAVVEGIRRFMDSDCNEVLNIGSDELISINNLAKMAIEISGKNITIKNLPEHIAVGIMGRNSDNRLIKEKLGWAPDYPLRGGMEKTYAWVKEQVEKKAKS